MKIKLKNILDGLDALGNIYNQKLSGVAAYRLSKTIATVKSEIDTFNEVRDKLLQEYAEPSEENPGQFVFKDDEMREKFETEINELLEKEVPQEFPKISANDLANVTVSAAELSTIDWMIE